MRLLCTDLDRTLLANGDPDVSPAAMSTLLRMIERRPLSLAYVTGRDLGLVREAIAQFDLPMPDAVIADIGTSVYRVLDGEMVEDEGWLRVTAPDWRGLEGRDVRTLLEHDAALVAQDDARQRRHKASYLVDVGEDLDAVSRRVAATMQDHELEAAVITSRDPGADRHLLDVVPAGATKRHAIEYLAEQLDVPRDQMLFSGDSGNDLDALTGDFPAVLVANADSTVRDAARERASVAETGHLLYCAHGGLLLPSGDMLNGNYSGGIVEGILHFFPALTTLLTTDIAEPSV